MNKPIENVEDFLDEIVSHSHGNPVRRRDTLALPRIKFLRETFPAIFAAGKASAIRNKKKQ